MIDVEITRSEVLFDGCIADIVTAVDVTGQLLAPKSASWHTFSTVNKMYDDKFSGEESAGLLHIIFPNYPDLQGMRSTPKIEEYLFSLREGTVAHSSNPLVSDTTH